MSRRILAAFVSLAGLVILSGVAYSQCEPSPAVFQILDRSYLSEEFGLTSRQQYDKTIKILEDGLAKRPHDFFLLRAEFGQRQSAEMSPGARENATLNWAEDLHKKYPRQPVYELFYAKALVGKNTPEAMRMLEALRTTPVAAQAHLVLADVFGFGKFKNKARVQQELTAFLQLCPAPFSAPALSSIARGATKEQIAATAATLRRRLQANHNPLLRNSWEELWMMEFKVHAPAEHDALRKQIAADLVQLEKSPARHRLAYIGLLRGGYERVGDKAAMDRLADEIITSYPRSSEAENLVQERWRKDHPSPPPDDKAKKETYSRALLAVVDDWHQRWPEDSYIVYQKFQALLDDPGTTPQQIEKAGDEMLAAYRRNPNWYGMPPAQARVAEAFLKYKIRLDDVPKLIQEGFDNLVAMQSRFLDRDTSTDDDRASQKDSLASIDLQRIRMLLECYVATKQTAKAHDFDAELAKVDQSKSGNKTTLLYLRGLIAELEGRKLDALLLYRASVQARTRKIPVGMDDPTSEAADRLWKELGGTAVGLALLTEKPKIVEVSDSRWERPKNPLPDFTVTDIEGKPVKLADFRGKAVLINLWATWCGPCRLEHPEFQKLYDKLKNRTDVVVLSITVDDDLGKVAPYMKENKYTFPVLLAREVVDAVVPSLSIPRNWFVSPQGKLEWEQIGYGPDPTWQDTMLAKLEETLKPATPASGAKEAATKAAPPPPPPPPPPK
jgi:thiol-disulfide isomerase/thioredoxin